MKNMYLWPLVICLTLVTSRTTAQTKQPPTVIADTFAKMFPEANKVEWKEKINNFTAFFRIT